MPPETFISPIRAIAAFERSIPAESSNTVLAGTLSVVPREPRNVAADTAGNLYITDPGASVVWRLTPTGTLTIFAGTGADGYGGDGELASDTTLDAPAGIAVGANGNVYFTEAGLWSDRVRFVTTDGVIHTLAGTGPQGFGGDGGQAKNAYLSTPMGVALDSAGDVFIADSDNNRIRQVAPNGVITTVAGSESYGAPLSSGDGELATDAQLNVPQSIAVNAAGDVYFGSPGGIRSFHPGGIIHTIAGNGSCDTGPLDGAALAASLCSPSGLAFGNSGDLYITDVLHDRIARLDAQGNISTYAGNGTRARAAITVWLPSPN